MAQPAQLNEGDAQMKLNFAVDKSKDPQMIQQAGNAAAAIGKHFPISPDYKLEIQPPNSLLTLQITMQFEQYYVIFYLIFLVLSAYYKGYGGLKYPPGMWGLELTAAIVFSLMQL